MPAFVSAREAVNLIPDNSFVLFGGSGGGHAIAETVIEALAKRYDDSSSPSDLTLSSVVSLGDWESTGFNRLAKPGLVKRVITAGLNNCPRLAALAEDDAIEAYVWPQGVLSQLCRDSSAGRPGIVTKVGLHTFVDPRYEGGRQSPRTTEDLVRQIEIAGDEYLFYPALPVDVAVIRGTTADERGNITMEDEAVYGEMFSMAAAARRRGGIVICQVKRVAQAGTLPGKQVKVPAPLVDYVVVAPNQKQTYQIAFDPSYAGMLRAPTGAIGHIPFDIRKCMARRAAMELHPADVVNLGFGVSNGISSVAVEEGILSDITLTVEQGVFGGAPAGGKDAGAGVNFDAMIDQPYQFDFYDGGGLDIAFLSFAQVDERGNVNVSKFGSTVAGPGGFINISQGTRRVVFSGSLTAKGLRVEPDGAGGVRLTQEGSVMKWVKKVDQITFNGQQALERGQQVTFVTDRAVFELTPEGPVCVELARGVDLDKDVRLHIGFQFGIAENLGRMDDRIFRDEPMAFAEEFRRRPPRRRGIS